jgi:hypothetical protein
MSRAVRTILLAACLGSGCSIGPIEVSSAPMAGVIGGVAWSFGTAETNAFLSMAASTSDQFFATAYQEALAPCTGAGDQVLSNRLLMKIPKETGDYLLGDGLNETFYVQSTANNYVATQGRIIITQVTDTMLSGRAHFLYDGNNEVDGQFQATICPP